MKLGVIDVVEWQTVVDMRTGIKAAEDLVKDNSLIGLTKEILKNHPYPGDLETAGIKWVTDVALDLYHSYQPQYMFLDYAQPYFFQVFREAPKEELQNLVFAIFKEISRLQKETGILPVVIGTGDMVPLAGCIDLTGLDGLALSGGMVGRCAGLYGPSERDWHLIKSHPQIERVFSKKELIDFFGDDEEFVQKLPDYFLMAKEGRIFKSFGSMTRPLYKVQGANDQIPLSFPFGDPCGRTDVSSFGSICRISDIRKMIEGALQEQKVALIVVEGIGSKNFPSDYRLCQNTCGWYRYAPGEGFYLTLTTGKDLQHHSYLPGYKYYVEDREDKDYPFSGYFCRMCTETLGEGFRGRSAAVGTRSIITHLASGADISIECFARGLYNYGTMGVVKKQENI